MKNFILIMSFLALGACAHRHHDGHHGHAHGDHAQHGHHHAAGHNCKDGKCETGKCPGSLALCSSGCVNVTSDPLHCGKCGKECGPGELCAAGICQGYVLAVGCTACPCAACAVVVSGSICCPALSGHKRPICVSGGTCP